MVVRVAAGLIGLAVLLPAIIFGGQLAVEVIVPIALAICVWEFASMAAPEDKAGALAFLGPATVGLYAAAVYAPERGLFLAVAAVTLGSFVSVLLRPGDSLEKAADRIARLVLGAVWIGAFLACLPLLRRFEHGLAWVFLVLTIPWSSDTGAFFAGKFFGKTKLYERVSPKKTVEGFVGGLVAATFGVAMVKIIGLPTVSWLDVAVMGLGLGSASVLGDLSESLLKRAYGVKDSGSIMPGHGGLLDRIDSLLFVAPLLYAYATWVTASG